MSTAEQAGLIVSVITIALAFAGSVRFLVKHYLSELKPNGGTSMKDSLNRLESRVDEIMLILATSNIKRKKEKPNGQSQDS